MANRTEPNRTEPNRTEPNLTDVNSLQVTIKTNLLAELTLTPTSTTSTSACNRETSVIHHQQTLVSWNLQNVGTSKNKQAGCIQTGKD